MSIQTAAYALDWHNVAAKTLGEISDWPESLFPPALSAHLSIFTERSQAPLDATIY